MTTSTSRAAALFATVLFAGLGAAPLPAVASSAPTVSATSTDVPASGERPARIDQFTGLWVAHTRGLRVRDSRVVVERIGSGCCDPIVDVVLRIDGVGGTRSAPRAAATVRQVVVHDPTAFDAAHPAPYVGEGAVLRIDRRGILHESATRTLYCGARDYHPACGA